MNEGETTTVAPLPGLQYSDASARRVSGSETEMSIAGIGASGASNTSTSNSSTSSAASTAYNTFLTLLTTQLQNQDPLNATDPNQFTSELIQITQLEGQQTTNSDLSFIAQSIGAITVANGVGYIGRNIEAAASTAPMQSGTVSWSYDLASSAAAVTLTVSDANGNTVFSTSGDTTAGNHPFSWDGTEDNGSTVSSGAFTLTVTASDSDGNAITSSVSTQGKVTGVNTSDGTIMLDMDGVDVPMGNVISVNT
jgi:flagellar basal-body rod modification protein FlgD